MQRRCAASDLTGKGEAFREDHLGFYRDIGLTWPPDLHSQSVASEFTVGHLSQRASEGAWAAHKAFQPEAEVEFVDVQKALHRLIPYTADGKTMTNPWRPTLTGLTGHSKIIMRYKSGDGAGYQMRSLLPAEHFALMVDPLSR